MTTRHTAGTCIALHSLTHSSIRKTTPPSFSHSLKRTTQATASATATATATSQMSPQNATRTTASTHKRVEKQVQYQPTATAKIVAGTATPAKKCRRRGKRGSQGARKRRAVEKIADKANTPSVFIIPASSAPCVKDKQDPETINTAVTKKRRRHGKRGGKRVRERLAKREMKECEDGFASTVQVNNDNMKVVLYVDKAAVACPTLKEAREDTPAPVVNNDADDESEDFVPMPPAYAKAPAFIRTLKPEWLGLGQYTTFGVRAADGEIFLATLPSPFLSVDASGKPVAMCPPPPEVICGKPLWARSGYPPIFEAPSILAGLGPHFEGAHYVDGAIFIPAPGFVPMPVPASLLDWLRGF